MLDEVEVWNRLAGADVPRDLKSPPRSIERLGGMTNRNYLVATSGGRYVLRVPGDGTEEYIDRGREEHNARVAAQAGVNAEVVYFNAADGVMVTRYIEQGVSMSPEKFRARVGAPARAGRIFRQLHGCSGEFHGRFDVFAMLDEYLALLRNREVALPDGYDDAIGRLMKVKRALGNVSVQPMPCHCDPLTENFIDDGKRMWLLDWEYSGMNDPMWDLSDLSVEAGLGIDHDMEMLGAYCGDEPLHETLVARFVIYKAMCDLLWTLWGLIQHINDNPVLDFMAYATERFERCRNLMDTSRFDEHVSALESLRGLR